MAELNVDILSLEDFHRSLDARITQVDHLLRQIDEVANAHVPLGTFPDAQSQVDGHGGLERGFADRLRQLHTAAQAAKQATASILANYSTAEARNAANAKDIAAQLGGVTSALGELIMVADYDGYSHKDLYAMVKAGNPAQVEGVAAIWNGLATTADDFARDLDRDLGRATATWSGEAGTEYARRISAMARFSRGIASETAVVGSRLAILAQLLREAQAKIEDPAETDDHDKTASYAATGVKVGSMLGPGGSVAGAAVGGVVGWLADDEEADKAKARTVQLVKQLAADYEISGPTGRVDLPQAPVELPTNVNIGSAAARAVGATAAATYAAGLGASVQHTVAHAAPGTVSKPGVTNPTDFAPGSSRAPGVEPADLSELGSGLAGAGDGVFTAVTDTSSGALRSDAMARGLEGLRGLPSEGAGAVGSVAGASRGTALAGSSSGGSAGPRAFELGAARPGAPQPPHLTGSRPAASDEEEQDERTTWLTEDDMAWGDDGSAPPSLLGRRTGGE